MNAFVHAAWNVLLALAPWFLFGAAVAGALHVVLPRDFIRRALRGRAGVLKAVLFGVPLPLCSCAVIPAGIGLKKDGASDGAAIGFLVSTPQTGVDSIFVSGSMLGWPFALFKLLAAFVLGLIAGHATGGQAPAPEVPHPGGPQPAPRTWRDGVSHAVEIVRSIWGWLVVGVLVSAAITTLVPADVLARVGALGSLPSMAVALVVAVPLYVCATASVPIAAALVHAGLPAGAALVFLMAGPATNLATIGAVRRTFGTRTLVVYLATIIVGSALLGWVFDFVVTVDGSLPVGVAHAEHASPWATLSALGLLGMLLSFAVSDLRAAMRRRAAGAGGAAVPAGAPALAPSRVELSVTGLTCDGCVRKLEGKLAALPGAVHVSVHRQPEGRAAVEGVPLDVVRDAIEKAGYSTP